MVEPTPDLVAARLSYGADPELARLLATHAGVILLRVRGTLRGAASDRVRAEGHRRALHFLRAALDRLRPADALLCADAIDPARLGAERVWLVDPLDGVREYGEPGRTDWAVSVALWSAGALVTGAVALPGLGPTLSSEQPPTPHAPRRGPPRMLVSRANPPQYAASVAGPLGAELLAMGSVGAKAMAVARGEADLYVHDGGQADWTSAGPVAVALAAGLHASHLDGSPLRYNAAASRQPDLLVCRRDLAGPALAAIAAAR
jgi:3'(2'), 5'-bisphosphate nucleotidase